MAVKRTKKDPWTAFLNEVDGLPSSALKLIQLPRILYAEVPTQVEFTRQDAKEITLHRPPKRRKRAAPRKGTTAAKRRTPRRS
jgi:hypothetical protein